MIWGIHLACQSQVHEMQHFSMVEILREGAEREGTFWFSFEIFLSSALFTALKSYLQHLYEMGADNISQV